MEFKPTIRDVLRRYQNYWNRQEPHDRPVVIIDVPSTIDPRHKYHGAQFGEVRDFYLSSFRHRIALEDDAIPHIDAFCYFGHHLMPSLVGSPVERGTKYIWAKPMLDDIDAVSDLAINWECPAYKRFRDFYSYFRNESEGRFCISQHPAKSPGELMCDLRGPERLIFDFIDQPDKARRLASRCLDLSIEYGKRLLSDVDLTEVMRGHIYCCCNWIPRDTVCFSEDHTVSWSPSIYREFVKPFDQKFVDAFGRSNMEWHSGSRHVFSEFPRVDAVEFNLDPLHSSIVDVFDDLIPHKDEVNLQIPCRKEEVEQVIETFGITGIMITTSCDSIREGNRLLDDIKKWSATYKKKGQKGPLR